MLVMRASTHAAVCDHEDHERVTVWLSEPGASGSEQSGLGSAAIARLSSDRLKRCWGSARVDVLMIALCSPSRTARILTRTTI